MKKKNTTFLKANRSAMGDAYLFLYPLFIQASLLYNKRKMLASNISDVQFIKLEAYLLFVENVKNLPSPWIKL